MGKWMVRALMVWGLLLTSTAQGTATFDKDYALVFFFRSDCGFCHRFAPVIERVSEQQGLFIYPFSMDGGVLPEYQQPLRATPDIVSSFYGSDARGVPTAYLVNVNTNRFVQVARGFIDGTQLQQRINQVRNDAHLLQSLAAGGVQ